MLNTHACSHTQPPTPLLTHIHKPSPSHPHTPHLHRCRSSRHRPQSIVCSVPSELNQHINPIVPYFVCQLFFSQTCDGMPLTTSGSDSSTQMICFVVFLLGGGGMYVCVWWGVRERERERERVEVEHPQNTLKHCSRYSYIHHPITPTSPPPPNHRHFTPTTHPRTCNTQLYTCSSTISLVL